MRWTPGSDSSDVEDRRGESGGGGGFGGGGLRLGLGGMIVLLVLSLLFRRNLFTLLDTNMSAGSPAIAGDSVAATPHEDTLVQFVTFVLDTAQATWTQILAQQGTAYQHAHLVLFRDEINSACGFAETASGPFYCPGDNKVYIDLGFYDELRNRFGAPGEFAEAYVLAHELGHHVQFLLGTEQRARSGGNDASVRLELQADCYAGVWGHQAGQEGIVEPGDLQDGLNAAAAVGDDRLQRMATGHVNPESFTHGTSRERTAWFKRGFDTGRVDACDTFSGSVDISQ